MQARENAPQVRKQIGRWMREMRKYLRGDAAVMPSQDTICLWIELAHMLECYEDVVDLAAHLYEAEANPWLYGRAQRLARLAKLKTGAGSGV